VVGGLYALPNLFGFDPALQVTARRSAPVDEALEQKLVKALADGGVETRDIEAGEGRLLFRFPDDATRARALPLLQQAVDPLEHLVALNLATATPSWFCAARCVSTRSASAR
jgi:preprotein translocase subunit SecD